MMGADVGIIIVILLSLLASYEASRGDRTFLYQRCVEWHRLHNCSTDGRDFLSHNPPPISLRLTRWTCTENCRYECMWITVQAFKDDGLPVPQFHGKWPFVRWYGIQEPASAIFSLLNFLCHLLMTAKFVKAVPVHAPMYSTWVIYSLFALNAWFSSTIFHIKDTPITEKMDYFGALAFVLSALYAFVVRSLGPEKRSTLQMVALVMAIFFICHVYYLSFIRFDYHYNLMVNVGVAVAHCIAWMVRSVPRCRKYPHHRKMMAVILCLNGLVCLELLDFAPLWWTFDAHALWHAGTVLLAIPWYSFAIEDTLIMMEENDSLDLRKKV